MIRAAAAGMMGVITVVTDRLRRTESIMIMILMIDLRECMSACVRQSSAGDVSPHTGSRRPVPSVLPARAHIRTNAHSQTQTRAPACTNVEKKMQKMLLKNGRIKEINESNV